MRDSEPITLRVRWWLSRTFSFDVKQTRLTHGARKKLAGILALCRKSWTDAFGEEVGGEIWDRFTVHHTPIHRSWLNRAEIEISLFARKCLGTRRILDLKTLRRETRQWNRCVNRARKKIDWKSDRQAARLKFGYKKNSFKRSKT